MTNCRLETRGKYCLATPSKTMPKHCSLGFSIGMCVTVEYLIMKYPKQKIKKTGLSIAVLHLKVCDAFNTDVLIKYIALFLTLLMLILMQYLILYIK